LLQFSLDLGDQPAKYHCRMKTTQTILSAETITIEEANALLTAYAGIGEALAGIAAKIERTHRGVEIKQFSAAEISKLWSGNLAKVMVGFVAYSASGMTQFGRTTLCIEKRTGHLVTDSW
jgi:hypothetical protein